MDGQRDIFHHDPTREAEAYRTAADTVLHDPHFTDSERQRRAEHYMARAAEIEGFQHRRRLA